MSGQSHSTTSNFLGRIFAKMIKSVQMYNFPGLSLEFSFATITGSASMRALFGTARGWQKVSSKPQRNQRGSYFWCGGKACLDLFQLLQLLCPFVAFVDVRCEVLQDFHRFKHERLVLVFV